jgi:hypothetical protein
VGGIGVVEVDVGGEAKAVADCGAKLEGGVNEVAGADLGGEDGAAAGEDLFAEADGDGAVLAGPKV